MTEHNPLSRSKVLASIIGAFLVVGLAVSWVVLHQPDQPQPRYATWLNPTKPLTDFKLVDSTGSSFDQSSLKGSWNLLFFGYTHCPDICPITLRTLNEAYTQLDNDARDKLRVIFVSVDPVRDTPEQLAHYVRFFNEQFIGLTGDPVQINRLTQSLGIFHMQVAGKDDANYLVSHSSSILIINPAGEFQGLFSAPHTIDNLVSDLALITQM